MDYKKRYAKLNAAQKQAVDTIDGPLMVIAGPGTGKTELLSMRVANILEQTDTLPENILCLTFTDSAATAMRERLSEIIGASAYKVAIHTFHSFGTETINQNGQFFFSGASFKPVDDLSTREILKNIFDELEYDNPLASKMNGEYTHLGDAIAVISELKKSGLTDEELRQILDKNDEVIEKIGSKLTAVFEVRISKQTLTQLTKLLPEVEKLIQPTDIPTITPLARVMYESLSQAISEAENHPKTTPPITVWKNSWMKKDHSGKILILKSSYSQKKLHALSYIYFKYLNSMREKELFDYDDMILDVVHCIETNPELKATLQEKYQYVLVDEFQDTNLAQMRILYNLTDNPVNENRPNMMVVGDDDQAIYSFHGADIGNILHFKESYKDVKVITLKENYRSTAPILSLAREIITQGNERLEEVLKDIDKTLSSNSAKEATLVELIEAGSVLEERGILVDDIKQHIGEGENPSQITVIARRHSELIALLPYFYKAKIAVNYERQDNVLENDLVILLEKLARIIVQLQTGDHKNADVTLSEIIGHPALGFKAKDIWKLSLDAYNDRKGWIELMTESDTFAEFANWLIELSARPANYPLERIIDELIGKEQDGNNGFKSPIYEYYFSASKLAQLPDEYLFYLEALRTIRTKLRDYDPTNTPTLKSFVKFIELNRELGNEVKSIRAEVRDNSTAVNLMTAHKAKGQEFDRVYIVNAVDNMWGERVRSRSRNIQYPENLPLSSAGDNLDERLRLFFVAVTRARQHLTISYSNSDEFNRDTMLASFLLDTSAEPTQKTSKLSSVDSIENEWYGKLLDIPKNDMKQLLAPTLQDFKLSVTNINNFIDLERGGPQNFLINNLLRFPQAMTESAAYGTAIHKTLQKAHSHMAASGEQRPVEDMLSDFEKFLKDQRLPDIAFEKSLQRGLKTLQKFFKERYDSFSATQKTELNFRSQQVEIDGAQLTGQLDLVDISEKEKTITITDYKTGKPSANWKGSDEYEKIKLHKYKQQLMFYKLLVENSRDYSKYSIASENLQFVEADKLGDIISLEADFSEDELASFKKLVTAVWYKIINLDLPDISKYGTSYKDILDFEKDLID